MRGDLDPMRETDMAKYYLLGIQYRSFMCEPQLHTVAISEPVADFICS